MCFTKAAQGTTLVQIREKTNALDPSFNLFFELHYLRSLNVVYIVERKRFFQMTGNLDKDAD